VRRQIWQRVTGRWVTVTGKRRECVLLISSDYASCIPVPRPGGPRFLRAGWVRIPTGRNRREGGPSTLAGMGGRDRAGLRRSRRRCVRQSAVVRSADWSSVGRCSCFCVQQQGMRNTGNVKNDADFPGSGFDYGATFAIRQI
jgi:hypothetical protein